MSPLAIRRSARGLRRHAAGLMLVLAIGGAIATHHTAMPEGHHGAPAVALELCLGVFTAVGAAVVAVAVGLVPFARRPARTLRPGGLAAPAAAAVPAARAGPSLPSLLCVWRR